MLLKLIILIICGICMLPVFAQEQEVIRYPVVSNLETQLLDKTFQDEDIEKRIERIELTLFAEKQTGTFDERVEKLKKVILGDEENSSLAITGKNSPPQIEPPAKTQDEIINELEVKLFKTTYPEQPIETRISRLENNVFNKASPEDETPARIERLSAVINAQEANTIYKDQADIQKYNQIGVGMSLAGMLLMILKGLIF